MLSFKSPGKTIQVSGQQDGVRSGNGVLLSAVKFVAAAAVMVAAFASWTVPATADDVEEQPLIELLQSDAPKAEKAITCKKLAVWGSGKAVPALAELLPDPELASWARIALEVIPDPAADQALRDAMETVEGRTLIGVINSIAVREDAKAVDGLIERMNDSEPDVASAAAVALGRIGNESAREALRDALSDAPEAVRSAVAEGCILCAETLLAAGKADEAETVYDEVRQADVPDQRIVEATRGAILARGVEGVPLLIEQLQSGEKAMVSIALMTARELSGPRVSQELVSALDEVDPDLQALLISALADRGDAGVRPAMLEAAKSGASTVRIAAIEVLESLGDASCVPVLLDAATADDEEVAAAAKSALKALPGDEVDDTLVERLSTAEGRKRIALIEAIGRRRIDAVQPLLKAVDDSDAAVRAAALEALGEVATLEEVPVLVERVINPPNPEDADVALKALRAACIRMPQREACAQKLADAMEQASASAQEAILETLKGMGGETALETVADAANSDDRHLQDVATRVLGEWMSASAGPVLLELAKDDDCPYQVRALRGYIRLPRQFGTRMSDEERVAMCRKAWEAAQRDAERELVLQVIERYPSVGMLRLAVDAAQHPPLKDEATAVAMSVAQKISGEADVEELLKEVQRDPVDLEIIEATYGGGDKQKDVTDILKKHATDFPLIVLPSKKYNEAFGGDPASGVVKQLHVRYRMDGKTGEAKFSENETIVLPPAN
ncbi:MAG: HEAT repeat domain-containing protein [Planctomycetota bacterium]